MRLITLSLLTMLSTSSAFAATVYDPEAFGQEPPSADTDSQIYTLCGNTYAQALPKASIGYIITSTPEKGVLTFQVIEPGLDEKPILRVKKSASVTLAAAAKKGELFAVFEPIKGSTSSVNVTIHGRVNGACQPLIASQTLTDAKTFPELVKMMINEPWNRK